MDWPVLISAFLGAIMGVVVIVGGTVVWFWFDDRRQQTKPEPELLTPADILEKDVQNHIVEHFDALFRGWQIYDNTDSDDLSPNHRPAGIEFSTRDGRIDILCVDNKDNLVVLELKRDKAPDKVVAQVERYITYVKDHIAKPDQYVKGIIVSRRYDRRVADSIARRRNISIWTFDWYIKLNKRPQLE